jgi:hypothetical protein
MASAEPETKQPAGAEPETKQPVADIRAFVPALRARCAVFAPPNFVLVRQSTAENVIIGGISDWKFETVEDGDKGSRRRPGCWIDPVAAGAPWVVEPASGARAPLLWCYPFEVRQGVVESGPPCGWVSDLTPIHVRPDKTPVYQAYIDNHGPSACDLLRPEPLPGQRKCARV